MYWCLPCDYLTFQTFIEPTHVPVNYAQIVAATLTVNFLFPYMDIVLIKTWQGWLECATDKRCDLSLC